MVEVSEEERQATAELGAVLAPKMASVLLDALHHFQARGGKLTNNTVSMALGVANMAAIGALEQSLPVAGLSDAFACHMPAILTKWRNAPPSGTEAYAMAVREAAAVQELEKGGSDDRDNKAGS